MKKMFIILQLAIAFSFVANAGEAVTTNRLNSENGSTSDAIVSTEIASNSNSSASIIYDGPAYSAGSGMIPKAAGSVNVYWTNEGCSVNGQSGYQPQKITGDGFAMMVNGNLKYMNYCVNYKGERYYFQY